MKKLMVSLFTALVFSMTAHATIEVHQFDTLEQEQQFKELSSTLRCPKCQNNTIADSDSDLALDIRQKVYEMTKAGKPKQEIIDYMIDRYGNFVTYNPPFTAATSILWFGPLGVLIFGFGFIILRSRAKRNTSIQKEDWDQNKEARLKALLEEKNDGDKQ